jgi:NAD(P)-dependent dehydrogenase (short-subunit alcohol dehydrogenase family)
VSAKYNASGHSALVTGAGRRLGRAFAEALAESGANVAVHYGRSAEEAEEVVIGLLSHGVQAAAVQADLADPEEAAELVSRSEEAIGEIDLLVNSAAIFGPVGALDASIQDWQSHLNVNLTAPFLIAQQFALSRKDKAGAVVNLLDWRAMRPGADHFPYTISKAGLAALTRGLAVSLAPAIRVNGLALGAILPPSDGGTDDPLEGVPSGRWGTVEEAIDALLFLLVGPEYVTGEILHVDGGRHLT